MHTRRMRVRNTLFLVVTICGLFSFGNAASAHIHTHQHNNKPNTKERIEDGACISRDTAEDHQEFEHEVILGMYVHNTVYIICTGT